MEKTLSKHALLIFAKYPEPGKVKTRLAKTIGPQAAAEVYKGFLKTLYGAHRGRGYDLVVAHAPAEKEEAFKQWLLKKDTKTQWFAQSGKTLGSRMKQAFSYYLRRYDRVTLIGSDLPNLERSVIEYSAKALETADVVLGPTEDGGYYLIALKTSHDIFDGIEWSSPKVFRQQVNNIKRLGLSVTHLKMRFDIDTEEDLERWREKDDRSPDRADTNILT